MHSGKQKAEPTSHCSSGTTQAVKYLIQNLDCHTNSVGINISYDGLDVQYQMARWLLDRGITSIGILKSNPKGIPAEIKEIKDRETKSNEIYWEKDNGILNLHSYVAKTKSPVKGNVLLLSIVPQLLGITKNDNKTSLIFTNYNFSRGRTDVVDQRMKFYSCKALIY